MDAWQRAMGALLWGPMKSLYRLQAEGIENLPAEGGYVLASNHLSNFDPWVLAYPLWPRRRLRSMAKAELFNPLLTPLLRASGAFPVRRGGMDRDAYRTAVEIVRSGEVLLVFPEGARRGKGRWKGKRRRKQQVQSGAARIALSADGPLVPAALIGTDRLTRLGPVRVSFGRPLPADGLAGRSRHEAAGALTERLMAEIRELEAGLRAQPGEGGAQTR
jgi:1-acyl-sn-glycerol-3-phosphate acyltransferase